jgi:hypothetical protein
MTRSKTQETALKILNALGLHGQQVRSLKIELEAESFITATVEMYVDNDKQLDRLGNTVTTEFQCYELTPIKTKKP